MRSIRTSSVIALFAFASLVSIGSGQEPDGAQVAHARAKAMFKFQSQKSGSPLCDCTVCKCEVCVCGDKSAAKDKADELFAKVKDNDKVATIPTVYWVNAVPTKSAASELAAVRQVSVGEWQGDVTPRVVVDAGGRRHLLPISSTVDSIRLHLGITRNVRSDCPDGR